jgi:hypothetical protein
MRHAFLGSDFDVFFRHQGGHRSIYIHMFGVILFCSCTDLDGTTATKHFLLTNWHIEVGQV